MPQTNPPNTAICIDPQGRSGGSHAAYSRSRSGKAPEISFPLSRRYVTCLGRRETSVCNQTPTTLLTSETKYTFRQVSTRYYKASSVALDPPSLAPSSLATDQAPSPDGGYRLPDSGSCSTAGDSSEAFGRARAAGRAHQGADLVAGGAAGQDPEAQTGGAEVALQRRGAGQDLPQRACGGEGGTRF